MSLMGLLNFGGVCDRPLGRLITEAELQSHRDHRDLSRDELKAAFLKDMAGLDFDTQVAVIQLRKKRQLEQERNIV